MNFIAIDVETANSSLSSICAVGAVKFNQGKLADEFYTLVNPYQSFDAINVNIHNISPEDVAESPEFSEVLEHLIDFVGDLPVVCHGHFDRSSITQACSRCSLLAPSWRWLDTARVARRTWPEVLRRGYGLKPLCKMLGHNLKHHHALEDAKAAGAILVAAMRDRELDINDVFDLVAKRISDRGAASTARRAIQGNPDGPLVGETVVFTGQLQMMSRTEAMETVASLGCAVSGNVSKKTTIVVVGGVYSPSLSSEYKTGKHKKAEALIGSGTDLRILFETEFMEMIAELS